MPLIDMQKLGNLLTAHWTRFVDTTALFGEVARCVLEADLPVIEAVEIRKPAMEVKVSLCDPGPEGLSLWVEFNVPRGSSQVAVGTLELMIDWSSKVRSRKVIGHTHVVANSR